MTITEYKKELLDKIDTLTTSINKMPFISNNEWEVRNQLLQAIGDITEKDLGL